MNIRVLATLLFALICVGRANAQTDTNVINGTLKVGQPTGSAPSQGDVDISGCFKINGTCISGVGSLPFTTQVVDNGVADPIAPVPTAGGTTGATHINFYVVAHDQTTGVTNVSPVGTVTNANATLSGTNNVSVAFTLPTNAKCVDILQGDTAHSATGGLCVSVSPFVVTTNTTASYTPPVINSTGFYVGTGIQINANPGVTFSAAVYGPPFLEQIGGIVNSTQYAPMGLHNTEAMSVGILSPPTATGWGTIAGAFYVEDNTVNLDLGAPGTLGSNDVAMLSQCTAVHINAACWGANTIGQDIPGLASGNAAIQSIETDMQLFSNNSVGTGVDVENFSTVNGVASNGIELGSLGAAPQMFSFGLNFEYPLGNHSTQLANIWHATGSDSSGVAEIMNPAEPGANQNSLQIVMVGSDGSSNPQITDWYADGNGNAHISASSTGSVSLDDSTHTTQLLINSGGIETGGNALRGVGTIDANGFSAQAQDGLTCAPGTPSSSFATKGGIVTHC